MHSRLAAQTPYFFTMSSTRRFFCLPSGDPSGLVLGAMGLFGAQTFRLYGTSDMGSSNTVHNRRDKRSHAGHEWLPPLRSLSRRPLSSPDQAYFTASFALQAPR